MAEHWARARRRGPMAAASPVAIVVAGPATRFIFRGGAEAARLCGEAFGCALPLEACRAHRSGNRAALWLGPDEWLLLAFEETDPSDLAGLMEAAAKAVPHSLVDVSHRQIGIEVSGPGAAPLINSGCPLDLDLSTFPVGMSTRTVLAKADVTLWREAEDVFRLEVLRSFSPYLLAFLKEAETGLI